MCSGCAVCFSNRPFSARLYPAQAQQESCASWMAWDVGALKGILLMQVPFP